MYVERGRIGGGRQGRGMRGSEGREGREEEKDWREREKRREKKEMQSMSSYGEGRTRCGGMESPTASDGFELGKVQAVQKRQPSTTHRARRSVLSTRGTLHDSLLVHLLGLAQFLFSSPSSLSLVSEPTFSSPSSAASLTVQRTLDCLTLLTSSVPTYLLLPESLPSLSSLLHSTDDGSGNIHTTTARRRCFSLRYIAVTT